MLFILPKGLVCRKLPSCREGDVCIPPAYCVLDRMHDLGATVNLPTHYLQLTGRKTKKDTDREHKMTTNNFILLPTSESTF